MSNLSEQKEREIRSLLENLSIEELQQALNVVKFLVACEDAAASDQNTVSDMTR